MTEHIDAEITRDAVRLYFTETAETASRTFAEDASERLARLNSGGRLTMSEARGVYGSACAVAALIGRHRELGDPTATQERFDMAMDRAEAIRRGLLADGYDIDVQRALGDPEDTEVGLR